MKEIRKQINEIDAKIISLIGRRLELALELAEIKRKNGIPVFDKTRENDMMDRFKVLADKYGVSFELIEKIYIDIIEESRRVQGG